MEDYTRKIVSAIVRGHGLKEVLRELLQDSINHLLTHELAGYLGYGAYDRNGRNTNDYRNGHYYKTS